MQLIDPVAAAELLFVVVVLPASPVGGGIVTMLYVFLRDATGHAPDLAPAARWWPAGRVWLWASAMTAVVGLIFLVVLVNYPRSASPPSPPCTAGWECMP